MKKYFTIKYSLVLIGILLLFYAANTFVFAAKNLKAPPSPVNLKVSDVSDTSVTLKWDEPEGSDDTYTYKIYRNSTYIDSSESTTYTVNNLKPGTTYKFYIRAEAGNSNVSPASEPVSATAMGSKKNSDTKIVGYYPAWKTYSGFTPDKLDVSKLTHINYAFAYIGQDNEIKAGYPDKDFENFKKLNEFKNVNPDLKILISAGGWNWSGKFSDMASTDASRTVFAESCVKFITQNGIDGVDLDWEYPVGGGLPGNSKSAQDKRNFTLLLEKIREKLDEQGIKDGRHYLLTIAGGASNDYLNNIEPAVIGDYVDFANIMTYDLHGPWDPYSDFNAPLYSSGGYSPQYKISVDSSVNAWVNAGFPKDKLVLGVSFYGYMYRVENDADNGLYQKFSEGKALSYGSIKSDYLNNSAYVKYYDKESMVPWLYGGGTFISYDDEQSIGLKAEYIKNEGLGGAMIWELSQDYNYELLKSIFKVLK